MPRCRIPMPVILSTALTLAACGSDATSPTDPGTDPGTEPGDTATTVIGTVGGEGGTLNAQSGAIRLDFPAGAVSQSTEITVAPAGQVPGTENLVAGSAFDFGPDGLQFAEPVELSLAYDPDALPEGFSASSLGIYRAGASAWEEVEWVAVDTVAHRVTARISSFSVYALRVGRVEDISGAWSVVETVEADECTDAVGETYGYGVAIEQDGAAIVVTVDGESYQGTVEGSEVRWSGSYEEDDGGTVSLSLHVTIEPGGDRFEGTSSWSYTGPAGSCGGRSSFVGTRGGSPGTGGGDGNEIARIEITPLINNVPQPGSTVTVRPEIGESLTLQIRAYDADDVELSNEPIDLTSSAAAVLAIQEGGRFVETPATEVRPVAGEPGTARITASAQWQPEISASVDIVVERPVTAVTLALPTGSLIHDLAHTIDVQDENPYVDYWLVRLGNGEPIDTIQNTSIDCQSCGPKLYPTLFWSMDVPEHTLFGDQVAVNVEGYTDAGTLVSQSSTHFYTAAPIVYEVTVDGQTLQWGRFARTEINHNLSLSLVVDALTPQTTFDMCQRNAEDLPMAQVLLEIDYVMYRSSYASGDDCSGSITVSGPGAYTNGHVYTLQFSGNVANADGVLKSVSGVVVYPVVPGQASGTGVSVNGW